MSFNDEEELDIKNIEEIDEVDDLDDALLSDDPIIEDSDDFGLDDEIDEEDGMPEGFAGLDGSEY